ncbi:RNA polymerase sigma factor [Olivibacter domesticus]|uniref:RNA polymerase sigma factor, sigma-70 family n=1 Tax=Olivibacter domesticus TaxID=407022 RepID=A0A1H7LQ67_OLID1|nr:sigma-70 family RNA polymerase sigma factor [Olivibacter domesticus]SEL00989.1 RNA polymerase sigma factor, sigma-70 family [Olivibacter domesticus]
MTEEKQSKILTSIKSYGKELLGFIRKRVNNEADAEDILQDVWYQLSAVVNSQPVEQISAWLYRVAKNKIIDKHRKKKEVAWDADLADEDNNTKIGDDQLITKESPETVYYDRLVWKQLFIALEELPAKQRDVFIWHELDNIPFAEISKLTGEPVNKLVLRKHYAVLHLRKQLNVLYKELIDK